MNNETIIRECVVQRPFEARIISNELRDRVQYFKNLLNQKRVKAKPKIGQFRQKKF